MEMLILASIRIFSPKTYLLIVLKSKNKIWQKWNLCGKFQAPLGLLLIWAIIFLHIYMIWTNLEIVQQFFFAKSKMKVGPVYENKCQLLYLGPHNAGRFWQKGACQSTQFRPLWNLKGVSFMKKLPTCVFGAPYFGTFGHMTVLPIRPE